MGWVVVKVGYNRELNDGAFIMHDPIHVYSTEVFPTRAMAIAAVYDIMAGYFLDEQEPQFFFDCEDVNALEGVIDKALRTSVGVVIWEYPYDPCYPFGLATYVFLVCGPGEEAIARELALSCDKTELADLTRITPGSSFCGGKICHPPWLCSVPL